jgi:hypothetical protein
MTAVTKTVAKGVNERWRSEIFLIVSKADEDPVAVPRTSNEEHYHGNKNRQDDRYTIKVQKARGYPVITFTWGRWRYFSNGQCYRSHVTNNLISVGLVFNHRFEPSGIAF